MVVKQISQETNRKMVQGDGVSGLLDRLEDENDRLQGNDKWFGSGCFLLRGMC